jgi:hypothetical protein
MNRRSIFRAHSWPLVLGLSVLGLVSHATCLAAPAAPVDLGQNLTYVRLHHLPDDLPALNAAWSKSALILDLRYPSGDNTKNLADTLAVRAPTAPLLVLIGPSTPADAVTALRTRDPAMITLGLPAPGLKPDIALAVKPEDDRSAYEALDAGTSVELLINDKPAAKRFNEAALVHERARESNDADRDVDAAGTPADAPAPAALPGKAADGQGAPSTQPKQPKDLVLQRAVQLHRALLALVKLPQN